MNIQDYLNLKMLEQQQQSPQEAQGSQNYQIQSSPSGPMNSQNFNVLHGTFQARNPISSGSSEAIKAVRESLGYKTGPMERSLGRLLSNIGRGFYAKSGTPFGQQMSQINYDPYAEEDEDMKRNMEILKYLQDVKRVEEELEHRRRQEIFNQERHQQQHNLHQQQLSEQERHHRASENLQSSLHAYDIDNMQEANEIASKIREETGDYVQPIGAMKPAMQQYSNKQIDDYIQKTNASVDGLQTVSRMKQIATDHPSILNNWNFVIANMYNQHPGFWQQAALNLKLNPKDKDAFFEMASLAKNFNINSMKAIPSKGMNQMIERELFSANPNARMSQGALLKVLNKAQEGLEHGYQEYSKGSEYGRQGMLYKPMARTLKTGHPATPAQHAVMSAAESPSPNPSLESLSDEQLDALLSQP